MSNPALDVDSFILPYDNDGMVCYHHRLNYQVSFFRMMGWYDDYHHRLNYQVSVALVC